jgi:hypothetical protein
MLNFVQRAAYGSREIFTDISRAAPHSEVVCECSGKVGLEQSALSWQTTILVAIAGVAEGLSLALP